MIQIKKRILPIFLIIALSLSLTCCRGYVLDTESTDTDTLEVSNLTTFNATTLSGDLYTQDDFEDYDLTIIYFWAKWSEKSVYELQFISDLRKQLPDNINLITSCFDVDSINSSSSVKSTLSSAKMSKCTTLISGDQDYATVSEQITDIPATIIVNSKGKVVAKPIVGIYANQETFNDRHVAQINAALKKIKKYKKFTLDAAEEDTEDEIESDTTEDSSLSDFSKSSSSDDSDSAKDSDSDDSDSKKNNSSDDSDSLDTMD